MAERSRLAKHEMTQAAPCSVGRTRGDWFLSLFSLILLGYALLGRGFAYLGVPPFYVGEAALTGGLAALLLSRGWSRVFGPLPARLLVAFMAFGALRTLPYLGTYGIDALRDAVIWGYGVFAIIVAGLLIARPARLAWVIGSYRKFAFVFPPLILAVLLLVRVAGDRIPLWPWVDIAIFQVKLGDIIVHLSGILAFTIGALGPARGTLWVPIQMLMVALGVFWSATGGRAAMLAFLSAATLAVLLKPGSRAIWRFAGVGLFALLVVAFVDIKFSMPGSGKEHSVQQLILNLQSIVMDSEDTRLESTKLWRLDWWGDIYEYTFEGAYFWGGKGYGINLADSDGFQVVGEGGVPLRSPHNGHLTILARSGVPGFLLWLALHAAWAASVFGGYRRSRRAGDRRWAGLFLFLLAYWIAFLVNGAFDVYLEGPMGGIWFWTVFGIGLAAVRTYRRDPRVLDSI